MDPSDIFTCRKINTAICKVDVDANRNELRRIISAIKMAYLEEGPIPNHHPYGWIQK